jgi:hypothetical protein
MAQDKKAQEEVYGISTAVEDPARVIGGYGETIKRHGAKTKEVQNVSALPIISVVPAEY